MPLRQCMQHVIWLYESDWLIIVAVTFFPFIVVLVFTNLSSKVLMYIRGSKLLYPTGLSHTYYSTVRLRRPHGPFEIRFRRSS